MIDEGFVEDQAGLGLGLAGISTLDPKIATLLQVGVSAALGSPAVCLEWSDGRALADGASEEEIADMLLAIAPVAGLGRVVAAAPEVAPRSGTAGCCLTSGQGGCPDGGRECSVLPQVP